MAARDLRKYLGLHRPGTEHEWCRLRDRVTYLIKEHLDLSPSALGATYQRDGLGTIVQTIFDEAPRYFRPHRQAEGSRLLREYVITKCSWVKWGLNNKTGTAKPDASSRANINNGEVALNSGTHAHRYPTRGSGIRVIPSSSTTLANVRVGPPSRQLPPTTKSKRTAAPVHPSTKSQKSTHIPNPDSTLDLDGDSDDYEGVRPRKVESTAAQVSQDPRRLVPVVELPTTIRRQKHRHTSLFSQDEMQDSAGPVESRSPSPVPVPAPAPAPAPPAVVEVIRRNDYPAQINPPPQDELAVFLETRCQRSLRHLYPFLRRYGCHTMDDVQLISQWPLPLIKQVVAEVKDMVPHSQLRKIEMLDWDILVYSISRVAKE
ncbi:hypothetical protein BDN72DRAFT_845627 [Pluteus cervinus]|uniref:Uncharacterized protein n=1 Tax=Pluteus cervinus TaxID=181527 RepID=A0ACD3AHN6_9AGAR|nr:hypothetical protein BDN72DRAFT_845627 [Pluteus cervinus]